ncbi:protein FAM228A isoform X3 [Sinocyclocheilus grahami]|uniref:protein FAM228A isoform X3 n=1 Tax=Sinocyclocheilus grahami TaxID=75366 RepID=UPI0007AC755A|nr:PREDICTED: protein FAM228B isoform X3 [Sinocyclocheilus grahami]
MMTQTKTADDTQHTLSPSSKKQLQEQLHSEQQEVDAIIQPLLETEAGFIKNLDHYLTLRGTLDLRKRKLLHKRWTQSVWLPGFVFLESYDPLEYNPFEHHFNTPHHRKISTPKLEDPLSLQSRARIKEKTAILRCQTGHVYRRQQVEELLQSPPVSQQSRKQSRAKASRDTASERLWENRNLFKSRSTCTPHSALAEGRCFLPQCWSCC